MMGLMARKMSILPPLAAVIPYSLNISRGKIFADSAVLFWIVKILTSKNLF